MDLAAFRRLQVTLFIPEPVASDLDALRQRWDPVMTRRIRPHITILRRVDNAEATCTALHTTKGWRACRLRLGSVQRAPDAHGSGVFVDVLDPHGDVSRIRAGLAAAVAADSDAVQEHPHVTLAHARTVARGQLADAWQHLRRQRFDRAFVIDRITLIGETDDGWSCIDSASLAEDS